MLAVYTYSDAIGVQHNAESDAFNFVGTWSSTGSYQTATLDTVDYSNGQFTCIVDNTGYNPQTTPTKWSPLVLRVPVSTGLLTINTLYAQTGNNGYMLMNFVNGQLVSLDPYANILVFDSVSAPKSYLNPSGNITYSTSDLTSITGHNCINLTALNTTGTVLATIDLTGAINLADFSCNTSIVKSFDLSQFSALTSVIFDTDPALTSFTTGNLPNLTYLECEFNSALTTIDISGCAAQLTGFSVLGCAMTQEAIDGVLAVLVANGLSNGTCYLQAGSNAPPSPTGVELAGTLVSRGWIVNTS